MIDSTKRKPAVRFGTALLVFALLFAVHNRAGAAEAPLAPPEQALLRVVFEPEESALDQTARENLNAFATDFAKRSGRLEIKAYAGPPHDTSSNARRLALRRALSVRRELVGGGIVVERIYVRALGGTSDSGPQDRVDIKLFGG
ncbi:OmpA family protein [Parvibaculum sp.]|uniref:OmpA family protein n=1 Tax=Parvibaculum sp. TaxID=2024848 RepID=UPI00271F7332|nr:OmpA family protein [Parvibaculum sp.]MDO9126709.1 OmpA family protein [Parvibaculum sp.]MDP2151770.1 OmpA family protein [Parvibaculum sp.]MDP3328434.1 OmpA family protein [Parvibaculum sp.]